MFIHSHCFDDEWSIMFFVMPASVWSQMRLALHSECWSPPPVQMKAFVPPLNHQPRDPDRSAAVGGGSLERGLALTCTEDTGEPPPPLCLFLSFLSFSPSLSHPLYILLQCGPVSGVAVL